MQVMLDSDEIAEIVDISIENALAPMRVENRRLWGLVTQLQSSIEESKQYNSAEFSNLSNDIKSIEIPEQKNYDSIIDNFTVVVKELNDKLSNCIVLQDFLAFQDQSLSLFDDLKNEINIAKDIRQIPGKDGRDGVDGAPGKDGNDGVPGQNGQDGVDGQNGTPGENGRDGIDGKSITIEDVIPFISNQIDKFVSNIELPKDGIPGRDGIDGKDGRDGIDGENGKDGVTGKDGSPGLNGKDGIGLAGAMIDRDGNLFITCTNGETKSLGLVVGKDGRDGNPGRDGISFPGEDGPPGRDGKDGIDIDETKLLEIVDNRFMTLEESTQKKIDTLSDNMLSRIDEKIQEITIFRDGTDINSEQIMSNLTIRIKDMIIAERDSYREYIEKLIPIPQKGEVGETGESGTSVTVEDVMPFISAEIDRLVGNKVASIPIPRDGVNITVDDVTPIIDNAVKVHLDNIVDNIKNIIDEEIKQVIQSIPVPKDIDMDIIQVKMKEMIDSIPKPQDGYTPSNDDLVTLIDTVVENRMKLFPIPKDGISIVESIIDQSGCLIQTMSDGTIKNAGVVTVTKNTEILPNINSSLVHEDNITDDVAEKVAKAVGLLAESINLPSPQLEQQPPVIVNVTSPTKRIITRRDNDGNLIADVTET